MMLMHILSVPVMAILSASLLLAACSSEKAETLRLSHITSPTSSWQKGAVRFAELVEKRSQERIRVKVYPSGQITNHNQQGELQMLASGSIDMALVSTIILALYLDPRFDLFGLPWLFPDHETAHRICDGEIGKRSLRFLEEKGMKGLAFGVNGFRQITNSVRPIRTPENLKGIRCRVAGSRMYFKTFEQMGGNALTMNFGEVFTSLQQGVIDAQENPLSIIYSSRLYEAQHYLTIWNYSYDPLILIINRSRWSRFSAKEQALLLQCANEAMNFQRDVVLAEDRSLPDLLRKKGMQIIRLTDKEVNAFKKKVGPVYHDYFSLVGKELVEQIQNEINKIKKNNQ